MGSHGAQPRTIAFRLSSCLTGLSSEQFQPATNSSVRQRFIPRGAIIFPFFLLLVAQQPVSVAQPVASPPYPLSSTPAQPILAGPPYLAPLPRVIQPAPAIAPVTLGEATVVPLPSQTPGSIFGPPVGNPWAPGAPVAGTGLVVAPQVPAMVPVGDSVGPLGDIAPGGMVSPQFGLPAGPEAIQIPATAISVPVTDDNLAWEQIVDVVSDYFTVAREQQARRGMDNWAEGRIETAAQDGATWLEPHRKDSVGEFNRWESTFQTIRRRATVRVIPNAAGFTIEVIVEKELEDLPHPERATAGAATFRYDSSLPTRRATDVSRTRSSPRWIAIGRDPPLEQRMLAEIHARLTGAAAGSGSIFSP